MRVLVVHNQLWAHYKSWLFSEIHRVLLETDPQSEFLVAQIALNEASRSNMQPDDTVKYHYPYQVLFNRSLDSVTFQERRKALFRIFKEYKPTVLNITGYFDMAQVLLMFYARLKGVKVVISSESSPADHERSGWRESVKSFIVGRGNAFFCFGKSSAEYLENLGVNPADIAVRNAAVVDEDLIRSRYEEAKSGEANVEKLSRSFIYVGRLAPEKNLEMLLRAYDQMLKANPNSLWKLTLVGDGPARSALEKLVDLLELKNKVSFPGGFPWYQIPDFLAKSDVLILPSKSEPWGLVVNEAMICSMPVIVSEKCGCVPDLVKNEVNGFTFDPAKQSELVSAMQFFEKKPGKIAGMGQASLELIAPFSSRDVAAEMVKCYQKLDGAS
ncbi:glycosyltransferase family 4 protein [Dyadobacter luticola]|uniref:Glycosyltransferase family 4 protein n=1 Tax=Dyadobacter luticola TaxID=1979387 RepID=A0A5R9L276_9BACT|nr:glycosyltransferase family 4 protein [Dyadobacter luticola]TLV02666.1 glycosyltransferase family 4 protein [Dyadobacter luticola]